LAKKVTVRAEVFLDVLLKVDDLDDKEILGAEDDHQYMNVMVEMMLKFVDGDWNEYFLFCQAADIVNIDSTSTIG